MNKLHAALVSFLITKADDTAVIEMHNAYAASDDDFIYTSIEDIADTFATDDRTSLARMVHFGDVESWYARYFALDGYGNIYSFGSLIEARCPINFKLLAAQIIENGQYADVGFNADPYLSDDE